MTEHNLFTSPIDALLRQYVYGEITIRQFHAVFCQETCRDWKPFHNLAYQEWPRESASMYERRFSMMVELEEESRICQGHLVLRDTLRGMQPVRLRQRLDNCHGAVVEPVEGR